jgi:hypothetical protein
LYGFLDILSGLEEFMKDSLGGTWPHPSCLAIMFGW